MISLEPMSTVEIEVWFKRSCELYRSELIQSGVSAEIADAEVTETIESTFKDGVLAKGNFVFNVSLELEKVGIVWLLEKGKDWFIYDIEIVEERRGTGLGRQTMHLIEGFVREHGGTSIGLSVFGFNDIARKLYESEGFKTTRFSMRKTIK